MEKDISLKVLSDIIVYMKYARFIEDKNRRETWNEIIDRNMFMHMKKYKNLTDEINENYKLVYTKKVLPSMRSCQFAGQAIEVNPARLYNCSGVAKCPGNRCAAQSYAIGSCSCPK